MSAAIYQSGNSCFWEENQYSNYSSDCVVAHAVRSQPMQWWVPSGRGGLTIEVDNKYAFLRSKSSRGRAENSVRSLSLFVCLFRPPRATQTNLDRVFGQPSALRRRVMLERLLQSFCKRKMSTYVLVKTFLPHSLTKENKLELIRFET